MDRQRTFSSAWSGAGGDELMSPSFVQVLIGDVVVHHARSAARARRNGGCVLDICNFHGRVPCMIGRGSHANGNSGASPAPM